MKEIVFVFPAGCYPVPAINGGAVESLINVLIDENEKYGTFKFHIIMCKSKNDTNVYNYSSYKNTKFYDYYQSDLRFKFDRYVNAVNKRTTYSLPLYSRYERYIVKTIAEINPDFVIFEGALNASIRKLSKLLGEDKMVYHVHHQVLPKTKINKFFGRMLCVSEFIKHDWQEYGLGEDFKYDVLNNCLTSETFKNKVDKKELTKLKDHLSIQKDDFVIIYCGRLVQVKGIDILIKAINSLKNSKIKLVIVGESAFKNSKVTPYVEYLRKLVNENKNNICFTGFIPNQELYKYYALANLQVIPSVWEEAAGIVALEGRSMGIPQIITNSGGLPEYASKSAVVLDKQNNLEEQLRNEINNFVMHKYDKFRLNKEVVWDGEFYYKLFTDIID